MSRTLRALLVQARPEAVRVARQLRRAGYEPVYDRVEDEVAFRASLARQWDVVLSEWRLPGFGAPDALAVLRQFGRDVPLVVVSGQVGEDLAADAFAFGARDLVELGRPARLGPVIERELRDALRRAEHRRLQDELQGRDRSSDELLGLCARDPDPELRPVDLVMVMEATLRVARSRVRRRATVVRAYGDTPPVLATEPKLARLLLDLLVTAAEALPVGPADRNQIRVSTRRELRQVVIEVSEDVGRSPGLGLPSVCRELVADLGGCLTVTRRIGAGTTFAVSLPIAGPAASARTLYH